MELGIKFLTSRLGLNDIHCISTFSIPKLKMVQHADVLNFHILHSNYFSYLALPKLLRGKAGVFTLHDMWNFTGHCAYSYDCKRWETGCGKCPYLSIQPQVKRDSTALEWRLKQRIYGQIERGAVVCPSQWLSGLAQRSILNRFPIYTVPYGLDLDAYRPLDRDTSRRLLGIDQNKFVLLCGAANLKDTRKGGDLLMQALQMLPLSLKSEISLLILGSGGGIFKELEMIEAMPLGYVSSDRLKSAIFSAADLFLFPTRADNLPLILQESMACGTPMVSFDIGGVPDLVRHGITGYLAKAEDAQDFAAKIVQLLEDPELRQQMAKNCRAIAEAEYPLELQAKRYIEIYKSLR
ncbi:MAG: glycosyltransferase [Oscillatoriales cyanobacterium SM2_2_1]|nr:glycosyltransferase [Oscillatoriales cyanobacterium SM2_2_1]